MEDDESILAALEREPEAYALFYRRHVGALLADLRRRDPDRAADACAETFATALLHANRFDPERASAAEWLNDIARGLLDRGQVSDRVRRRLGMAALAPGEGFVDSLEEELVEAARYLATRRRPARPPVPAGVGALAAIVLVAAALVAVFVLSRGGGDAGDRASQPFSNAAFPLLPMQPLRTCDRPARQPLLGRGEFRGIALLDRRRRSADALPVASSRLPIGTFDERATRRAGGLHVVPSTQVSIYGVCGEDHGPGTCLVADRGFRCFEIADVHAGRAVARTRSGTLVGLVPDRVGRVTLSVPGHTVTADVEQNVFDVQLDAIRGTPIELALEPSDDCGRRTVAPELRRRIPALREQAQPGYVLPAAAAGVIRERWAGRIHAVAADDARLWGTEHGVDVWVVPVVPAGQAGCAPATRACVIALPADSRPHGMCEERGDGEEWWLGPLLPGVAAIYGVVPGHVSRVRVTIDGVIGEVEARDGVVGGVLPFPWRDDAETRVELLR
jgi:Sigma-70 region 2